MRLHTDTEIAERSIDVYRDRLRQLTAPEREIDDFTARHLMDITQLLALAVTARNAHLAAATAVLDGLRRREPTPPTASAARTAPPAPTADLLHTR